MYLYVSVYSFISLCNVLRSQETPKCNCEALYWLRVNAQFFLHPSLHVDAPFSNSQNTEPANNRKSNT